MGSKILWALVGGFLLGVLIRSFFPVGLLYAAAAASAAAAALSVSFFYPSKTAYALVAAVALIAFGAGILRMDAAILLPDSTLAQFIDKKIVLEGVVVDEPDVRETNILVPIQIEARIGTSTIPLHVGVLALSPAHSVVAYGDRVRVEGKLRQPQAFDTGTGRQFNYPHYLAKDGISYELSYAQIEVLSHGGNPVKSAAIYVKQLYLRGLGNALPEPEAGLAGGITVGDKRSIGKELSDDFRRVSLVHIVVLSGYNITIVINALAKMTAWATRYAQFGVSGIAVFFFILMSGGAASAVRAGIMAMLAMFARVTGRVYLASRALGLVALAMVLWNPYTLGFDPSFQLSALATLGLIMFTPLFASRMHWLTEKFGLREIAASTMGTQLAVLPLLLYQNGQLSLVSLPVNLLALIPIPLAMFFSFIAAVAGMFLGPFAVIVGFPAYVLLAYVIDVAQLFAALPFAAVSVPAFGAWILFFAYGMLFGGVWYMKRRTAGV